MIFLMVGMELLARKVYVKFLQEEPKQNLSHKIRINKEEMGKQMKCNIILDHQIESEISVFFSSSSGNKNCHAALSKMKRTKITEIEAN